MIRYLKHNQINKQKWDQAVSISYNSLVYAYSWYLDIVSPGWEALIEDDYYNIMPLTGLKKYGVNYLAQPLFTQQLGVFSKGKIDDKKVNAFLSSIPDFYKFIDIALNFRNEANNSNYVVLKKTNFVLNISSKYQLIAAKYSSSLLKNLKKAERHKLYVDNNISSDEVIDMYKKEKGTETLNIKEKNYKVLSKLQAECLKNNSGFTRGVKDENQKLISTAFFIKHGKRIYYLFSSSTMRGKETGANSLILDSVIKEFSDNNFVLDFEGSMIPGVAAYFARFGARECVYLQVKKNNLPFFLKWFKK